jgi:hypothetical protein
MDLLQRRRWAQSQVVQGGAAELVGAHRELVLAVSAVSPDQCQRRFFARRVVAQA